MAVVRKGGRLVDIPIRSKTIVKLRESGSGRLTNQRGIVLRNAPTTGFSRAYGRQVLVCTIHGRQAYVQEAGAIDLYPVGTAKRIPVICKRAVSAYKKTYGR